MKKHQQKIINKRLTRIEKNQSKLKMEMIKTATENYLASLSRFKRFIAVHLFKLNTSEVK